MSPKQETVTVLATVAGLLIVGASIVWTFPLKAPVPISDPEPSYTPEAREAHFAGTAVLSCVIGAKGKLEEVKEISKPIGKGLDASAINTVRTWRFKPGRRDGVPVPVRVDIEVTFKLL